MLRCTGTEAAKLLGSENENRHGDVKVGHETWVYCIMRIRFVNMDDFSMLNKIIHGKNNEDKASLLIAGYVL